MFASRRIASSAVRPQTGTAVAMRHMTDAQRAGASAGIVSGLMSGSPMTAMLVGGGTLLAFGLFSRSGNRNTVV